MLNLLSVYPLAAEVMLNGGVTAVLIGQGLLNFLTNIDHVELVIALI